MVGIMSCWKQALCMWMNFTYLRGNFAFWKNIFIESFDLKTSIQSRIINCFADKWKREKKKKKEEVKKEKKINNKEEREMRAKT